MTPQQKDNLLIEKRKKIVNLVERCWPGSAAEVAMRHLVEMELREVFECGKHHGIDVVTEAAVAIATNPGPFRTLGSL